MIQFETELGAKNGEIERGTTLREYGIIAESLVRDLEACKEEQARCKTQLESLSRDGKDAARIARRSFSRANTEERTGVENHEEALENLRKRISILETEKETLFEMWQMSWRAIRVSDADSKSAEKDAGTAKYNEEQMNGVKETYSEAIKALESKLLRAKENVTRNQALWDANREKVTSLTEERNNLETELSLLRSEARAREEANERAVESLRAELESTRNELDKARDEKLELHEKLRESRGLATVAIAKYEESKRKVEEALVIAETAIAEKEAALERESRGRDEKVGLETRLHALVEECASRLERELAAARESFERASKKSALEIKESKVELREKVTILDRLEREKRLLEEELEKMRHGSEALLQRSSVKVLELEEQLKEAHSRIEACEENCRKKYEVKIGRSDERIMELEATLAASSDRSRRRRLHDDEDLEQRLREADDRTKQVLERYSALETRFARTLDERENVARELSTLRTDYDREIAKRDTERRLQETQIRELRERLRIAKDELEESNARFASFTNKIETLQQDLQEKRSAHGNESRVNEELVLRLKTLQDKFARRTEELTQHVETHRKLCRRWKDEAKSLASKFQLRTKEFRNKASALRKENDELNKELLACRQQLAHCRSQVLNRYDQGNEPR